MLIRLRQHRLATAEEQYPKKGTQELLQPSDEKAEVVAGCGEDGVGAIALATLEIVAVHAVIDLDMADHRLNGGPSLHLAANGGGDTADLARDPDAELLRMVMAAVALVDMDATGLNTGQRFEIGVTGPSVRPSRGSPCRAWAWSTNWPPLGTVTGVTIETVQPNS